MEYKNSSKKECISAKNNNVDELMNVRNISEKTLHHYDAIFIKLTNRQNKINCSGKHLHM